MPKRIAIWEPHWPITVKPAWRSKAVDAPAMEGFAVPFQLQTEYGPLSFFSTTTIFGTPLEVTLAEFSLECFYPADAASVAILHRASENLPPR